MPVRVVVGERVHPLDHALGVQRSRLGRLRLGVDATARNWRPVTPCEVPPRADDAA